MACRASRLAFMLTLNTLFIYGILTGILLAQIEIVQCEVSQNDAIVYSSQPKFGDRLLPRHRHATSNISLSGYGNVSVNRIVVDTINYNISSNKRTNSGLPASPESPVIYYNVSAGDENDDHLKNSNNYSDRLVIGNSNRVNNNSNSGSENQSSDRGRDLNEGNIKNSYKNNNIKKKDQKSIELNSGLSSHVVQTSVDVPVFGQNDFDKNDEGKLRRRHDYNVGIMDQDVTDRTNISKADRLIEMSTEFFIIPSSTAPANGGLATPSTLNSYRNNQQTHHHPSQSSSTARPALILASRTPPPPLVLGNDINSTFPAIITALRVTGNLRKEPWVVPVLALASLAMLMMAAFEVFVLFKAWRTSPSRRHLFLGQMLLLGLFACSGLGAILTATPTVLTCATIRFGAGVAFALVFAALLVKCVFLISLNGGVYLPAPYQGLLLLFAVLIQVAIGSQWLLTQPPSTYIMTMSSPPQTSTKLSMLITSADVSRLHSPVTIQLCKTQFSEILLSMIYVVFLIIFVAILAIKSRGIRDNYREATYIGLAIGGAIPIWLGWTLCGLAVADRHKDACLAFGLIATSATVFLVMFMPKGRQLAAMGKEGLYVEDREEQFSSLSRAGSGYSPSFFHFKPIKYGVMGQVTTSTTNTGNTTSNAKHPPGAALGGDHVALVAAAPPIYTRMYHYFPAHMTHPICFYPTPPPPTLSPPPPPVKAQLGGQLSPTQLRYPGLFLRSDEGNLYTTLEPTLSSNPNVYFQRSGGVHPGMMY